MRLIAVILFTLLVPSPGVAKEWRVTAIDNDPRAAEARFRLRVDKAGIVLLQEADQAVQLRLVPADVVALWYDDYPIRNFGREWVDKMAALCRERCADQDIYGPLALAAAVGVGYVAARPFETREHYINIRYRKGDASGLLVLRTTWLDHYWVMTDLSRAVGKKWMNVPRSVRSCIGAGPLGRSPLSVARSSATLRCRATSFRCCSGTITAAAAS